MKDKLILAVNGGTPVRKTPMPARCLIGSDEKAAAMKVFDEAITTGEAFGYNGKYEVQYEKYFCEFMGGGFADGVNSGTNAIFVALGALQLDALSEVIVPPISDPGGVMPVLFAGCVPVMADSDPRSYNTCADEIAPLITERTRAILVAHILGEPVDMDPIMELAAAYHLHVIEDCAQAHGALYKDRHVGTIGDIAAFSTMFSKHHCTGAQGGVVYTKNEQLYWNARRFADRGKPFNIEDQKENVVAGLNCNLNDLSAAIGVEQLKKLPGVIERRRRIAEAIRAELEDCQTVSMGWQVPDTKPVYWFMRFKLNIDRVHVSKEQFCEALRKEGIPVFSFYRYVPCDMYWFKKKAVYGKSGFPWNCSDYKGPRDPKFKLDNVNMVTNTNFNIGINENYDNDEINDIVNAIKKVEEAYSR